MAGRPPRPPPPPSPLATRSSIGNVRKQVGASADKDQCKDLQTCLGNPSTYSTMRNACDALSLEQEVLEIAMAGLFLHLRLHARLHGCLQNTHAGTDRILTPLV